MSSGSNRAGMQKNPTLTEEHKLRNNIIMSAVLAGMMSVTCGSTRAADSDESTRLKKLEDAVQILQKENAELKREVGRLSKDRVAPRAEATDSKRVVETTPEEKAPVYVTPGGQEYKLTLGGYIQMNFEDGDVSAFEGRFGLSARKDRFRLRRARITLTGELHSTAQFCTG